MRFYEFASAAKRIKPKKPLTPDQARIKSMQDQVKRTQQAIKSQRARQKIKKGQDQLSSLIKPAF